MPEPNEKPRFTYRLRRLYRVLNPNVSLTDTPVTLKANRHITIPMRDGVNLKANVYCASGTDKAPAILSLHPYGKDNYSIQGSRLNFQYRISRQEQPVRFSANTTWDAPDPGFWVANGYAVVNIDARGFFASEGNGSLLSDQEAEDYYDAIEWVAQQDWCNGKIGLCGLSYLAANQWKVAALNPPSLKAICPWEGFSDAYRDFFYPGGVKEQGYSAIWLKNLQKLGTMADDYLQELTHNLRNEFYQHMAPELERISVPALVGAGFSDPLRHSPGAFRAFRQISSKEKWAYTHRGPRQAVFYSNEARATQLKFFNRYLKHERNDWESTPPVRLEVRDTAHEVISTQWVSQWPPAEITWQNLYLQYAGSALQPGMIGQQEGVTLSLPEQRLNFTYTFSQDTRLIGPMLLTLTVYCRKVFDARVFATVYKYRNGKPVPFEGTMGFGYDAVAQGRARLLLNDEGVSMNNLYSHEPAFNEPAQLPPEEFVSLKIRLSESATLFRKGDVLKLSIGGRQPFSSGLLSGPYPFRYEESPAGTLHLVGAPASAFLTVGMGEVTK